MTKALLWIVSIALIVGGAYYFFMYDRAEAPELPGEPQTQMVSLYYYSPELDTDETGNIMCSRDGLVAVERELPETETPLEDTIELLLRGELTATEEATGITTEYPLAGFVLTDTQLADGTLTLTFDDPNNQTSGGSCRAGILWFQIQETALQFEDVEAVQFQPEELFQP